VPASLKNQLLWCKKFETTRHEKKPRTEVHAPVPYLCTASNGGKTEDGRVAIRYNWQRQTYYGQRCLYGTICLGTGVLRHSAGGVGLYIRVYVYGMYCSQCACVSNRSIELYCSYYTYQYKHIYSTKRVYRNDYVLCLYI